MVTPSFCSTSSWAPVKGLSHMNVFIAGATNKGLEKSQALNCIAKHTIMSYAMHGMRQPQGLVRVLPLVCIMSAALRMGFLHPECSSHRSLMCCRFLACV